METRSRFRTHARGLVPPIGAYEPLLELGRGGMGTASLARATGAGGFERIVVIKRLHPHLLDLPEAVRRFLDEAVVAAAVQHANVVGTNQVVSDDDGYFLVLDYVEGGTLEELLDRAALKREPLPPPIVLRIALDALSGLAAAHEARDTEGRPLGILHRDVSLQNVLVGRDGVARIADFGIAKSALASVSTDKNYLVGKLLYMPREYLSRKPIGPELDIYSLGVTLWLALTGGEPWPDVTEAQLVRHILEDRLPPMASAGVMVAPQIEALVARASDPDPSSRFRSAREMADAIETIGRDTGWLASHGDVARYVESLLGVDLERRRERVASALAERRSSAAGAPDSAAEPASADVPPPAAPPRRWPLLAAGAGATLVGVAIGTWLLRGPAPSAAAVVATTSAIAPSAHVQPAASTLPPPPIAPTASVPSPAASPAASSAARRPPAPPRAPQGQPTAPTPAPLPTPASTTPDGIKKHNPYR